LPPPFGDNCRVTRDWDANVYERISTPMEEMGKTVLDRLELRGDETVLDAGCGTGRVTALLQERLPNGRVIAVDGSQAMVEAARERLDPDRTEAFVADLTELELPEPVDAILSTATFHWIADHDRLFRRLYAALKPGGRLVAQCGGAGNIAEVLESIEIAARDFPEVEGWSPWNFATPEETEVRLQAAGFSEVHTVRDDHARLPPGAPSGRSPGCLPRRRPDAHEQADPRRLRPAEHRRAPIAASHSGHHPER
jgi:trans-aconitate 2-methyltransferase